MPDDFEWLCRDCCLTGTGAPQRCPQCGSLRLVRHCELARLAIAHIDCDAFYAAVEKRDRPELRDRPVIVGGGRRGVVTTACYIARLSGVRSAMPMFKALQLCEHAVVIKPDFSKYKHESQRIFEKMRALTPLVQTLSLDEAWIDLSGTEKLHGAAPAVTLAHLQREIEIDVGLTVSIGLSANRFLAKVASEADKPRGFGVIGKAEAREYLATRSVSVLPGVGPVAARALGAMGCATVGDIATADPAELTRRLGPHGLRLVRLAKGEDGRPVNPSPVRKSLSAERTFEADLTDLVSLEKMLWPLCERVARQARRENIAGRTVTLKLREANFRIRTRRQGVGEPVRTAKVLFATSRALLREEVDGRAFRLIGVGLSDLTNGAPAPAIFDSQGDRALREEGLMDRLIERFGHDAIVRGRSLRQ